MHERSVAASVLRSVEKVRSEHSGARVRGFTLTVAEFCGVDSELVSAALRDMCAENGNAAWDISVERVPLEAHCETCSEHFRVVRFRFECPHCGSRKVRIEQGEELTLQSVIMESGDE